MVRKAARITVRCTRGDNMIAKTGRRSWNILATIVTRNGVGALDVSVNGASGSPLRIKSCVDAVEYVSFPSGSGTTWNWSDCYSVRNQLHPFDNISDSSTLHTSAKALSSSSSSLERCASILLIQGWCKKGRKLLAYKPIACVQLYIIFTRHNHMWVTISIIIQGFLFNCR